MSKGYEDEHKRFGASVSEMCILIKMKFADVSVSVKVVQKYEHITELTP